MDWQLGMDSSWAGLVAAAKLCSALTASHALSCGPGWGMGGWAGLGRGGAGACLLPPGLCSCLLPTTNCLPPLYAVLISLMPCLNEKGEQEAHVSLSMPLSFPFYSLWKDGDHCTLHCTPFSSPACHLKTLLSGDRNRDRW